MELPSRVLLVCAIFDTILFASVFSSHHESRELAHIGSRLPLLKYEYCHSRKAKSAVKCFNSMCGGQGQKCTIGYNPKTKECQFMRLNSQLIYFARERLIEGAIDFWWRTMYMRVKALNELPQPIGLWHFGHITQGMNLGSAGAMLDVRMTKDFLGQYYSWKHKFFKNSTLERFLLLYDTKANLYARFNNSHRPEQIYFSNGVTLGAWILMKLETFTFPWQDLITIKVKGVGNGNLTFKIVNEKTTHEYYSTDLKRLAVLYRNASGVPIQLHSKELHVPFGDGMKWRHFAVTVTKTGTAQFFLNGEILSRKEGSLFGQHVPNKIEFLPAHNVEILAGMACAAVFNSALDPTQVRTFMELCP